ncbi:MAG: hypothetical protein K8R99_04305 [Actinomycetia bacterium]|nr:hypothetical protein [Actinomycetes bacterium]
MRRTAIAVCALLALGACKVDLTVDVQVAADGSGTVTLTAIADAEVVAQAPGLAEDLRFDDASAAGWTVDGPTPTDAGGLQVVLTHTFATVAEATALLQSINGTSGPLQGITITQTDTESQLTTFLAGSLRVDGQLQAFADSDLLSAIGGSPYEQTIRDLGLAPAEAVSFTLTADLPGDPVNDGSTTQWVAPLDGTTLAVSATTAIAQGSTGIWGTVSTVALVALVAWCLVAIAFIMFVAKARRRRALAAASKFRPRPLTRR